MQIVVNVAGSWAVPKLGTMTLSSAANISLTSPGTAEYDAQVGVEPVSAARTATISANAPWNLTVAPNNAGPASNPSYWTAVNDPVYGGFIPAEVDKPSTDFMIGTTYSASGAGYLALPAFKNQSTALLSSQAPIGNRVVNLYWATAWSYRYDTPGTYTLPFKFTLTLP